LFPEVSFVFFSSLFSRRSTVPQTVQTIESWATLNEGNRTCDQKTRFFFCRFWFS
jgi:hypothetical protein